jgi:hypothetical protein
MRVAIHQPQYIPWLPYFSKIEQSDVFILLDSVEFQKNGLQNRNQIKTTTGAHWLTVPVYQGLGQKIMNVKIDNSSNWRRKHWQSIKTFYGKAVEFETYEKDLQLVYEKEWDSLCDLDIETITKMMDWMSIKTPILRSSQMQATGTASELILNLCLEAGATSYLSGVGGKNYMIPKDFDEAGIEIVYLNSSLPNAYPQLFPRAGFINSLSAIDLVLNCGSAWRDFLPAKVESI